MLTKRHLAIIRAALQFFDEEMSPHGPDVAHPYFEEPLQGELRAEELRKLRELLATTELRYLEYEPPGTNIAAQALLTQEQARSAPSSSLATVLLVLRP